MEKKRCGKRGTISATEVVLTSPSMDNFPFTLLCDVTSALILSDTISKWVGPHSLLFGDVYVLGTTDITARGYLSPIMMVLVTMFTA